MLQRLAACLFVAALAGCAATPPAPSAIERLPEGQAGPIAPARTRPVTLDEVVEMARGGTPPNTIIQTLRDSRATYVLSAEEGQRLAARGVPAEVIAYLRGAEGRASRPYYGYPYYGYPGYGPYAPYDWGYPWRPWYPGTSLHFGFGRRW